MPGRNRTIITRRGALKQLASVAAGTLVSTRFVTGQTRPATPQSAPAAAAQPVLVERLSTGTEIWQVTTEQRPQSNIYCELPYCSTDSRYFVYERKNRKENKDNPTEFMVVELGTWKQHLLDVGWNMTGCAITRDGVFYYLKRTPGREVDLMRADLSKGQPQSLFRLQHPAVAGSLGTVSPDGRYYARGQRLDQEYKRFGILLVDLQKGTETVIDEDPYNFNPHPQFDPSRNDRLMIQHNRGSKFSPEGVRERAVGPEGATLYLLSVPDAKRTELQVGRPYTTAISGHEAWIATRGEILLSVLAQDGYTPDKGNLLCVRPGQPARVAARGFQANHVHVSRCGRFFCCDDWRGTCKIVIGSLQTGRTAVICESKTSMGRNANTHPHAYLTPNLKWVVFNSDRSGFAHIHAASVPPGLMETLSQLDAGNSGMDCGVKGAVQ